MPDGEKLSCEISEAACERDDGRVGLLKRSTVFESIFFGIWSCLRFVLDRVFDLVAVVLVLSQVSQFFSKFRRQFFQK